MIYNLKNELMQSKIELPLIYVQEGFREVWKKCTKSTLVCKFYDD